MPRNLRYFEALARTISYASGRNPNATLIADAPVVYLEVLDHLRCRPEAEDDTHRNEKPPPAFETRRRLRFVVRDRALYLGAVPVTMTSFVITVTGSSTIFVPVSFMP